MSANPAAAGQCDVSSFWSGQFEHWQCSNRVHAGGSAAQYKKRFVDCIAAFNAVTANPWQLAASVGLFSFSPQQSGSLEAALAQADKAMYAEKVQRRAVPVQEPVAVDA